ncbi:TraM recognition domain-containing protein [uncultured Tateyamaria sp.]|uniref:type IV secretory system conjugative DNA transfer family protein n=1 Tax=uncultured Tateyamaria sp. TaxID=455651 RepID=UPI00260EECDA|nr:TraM recognition domain-containing protein [uncultured Tateyamaria sp.]
MSFPFGNILGRRGVLDTEGLRLIGLSDDNRPILAPKGHSLTLSAAGGGKTTRGAIPWIYSLLSTVHEASILALDAKSGEVAVQLVPMLAKMGVKVAVIDDMNVRPELAQWRVSLNPFGAAVATYRREPLDLSLVVETIVHALIENPPGGPDQNQHFRDMPQDLDEFAFNVLVRRDADTATPGAVSALLSDPDMLLALAQIEADEGDEAIQAMARDILHMSKTDNWGQHLGSARRSLKLFSPGNRLNKVGRDATMTHADLIRDGYFIVLVGPQANINRLGVYYALHILAFCDALYNGAGALRAVCDEFTNTPLKSLVESLTTLRAYGAEIHMIAQSRSEIIRRFGEQETHTIEENSVVKQWLGFSSIEEAKRISDAIGEQHALSTTLSGSGAPQENLSLIKQKWLSAAELMAMPREEQLVWIKGIGFFTCRTIAQNQIGPFASLIAPNPLEGGTLPADSILTLKTPEARI